METTEAYHYAKLGKLPQFMSYACKKSDIDNLLSESNSEAPFKTLYMSEHRALKKNKVDNKILLSLGHVGSDGPKLTIYSVPRELAGTIRLLMKEQGLPKIFAWFRTGDLKPQTWRFAKHSFALWLYSKTTELVFEDEYLN